MLRCPGLLGTVAVDIMLPPKATMLTVPAQVEGVAVTVSVTVLPLECEAVNERRLKPVPEQAHGMTMLLPLMPGLPAYGWTSCVVSILTIEPLP